MKQNIEIPKYVMVVLNQVFEIEKKLASLDDREKLSRPLEKIKTAFDSEDMQFLIDDPIAQKYDITRTDVETTIVGIGHDNLKIIEVFKPIIKITSNGVSRVIQKGVVIASSTDNIESK